MAHQDSEPLLEQEEEYLDRQDLAPQAQHHRPQLQVVLFHLGVNKETQARIPKLLLNYGINGRVSIIPPLHC